MAGDLELDPQKIHGRGRDEQAGHRGRNDDVAQGLLADQHLVAGSRSSVPIDAEPGRGVALWVEIQDQHALADGGKRCPEVDGGGGLADPALLVRHGENARARPAVKLANEGLRLGHGVQVSASANAQDRGLRVDDAGHRFDCISRCLGRRRDLVLS